MSYLMIQAKRQRKVAMWRTRKKRRGDMWKVGSTQSQATRPAASSGGNSSRSPTLPHRDGGGVEREGSVLCEDVRQDTAVEVVGRRFVTARPGSIASF